jgi:hypothetical protein
MTAAKKYVLEHYPQILEWLKEERTIPWVAKKLGIAYQSLEKYLDKNDLAKFKEIGIMRRRYKNLVVEPFNLDEVRRYMAAGHSMNSMAKFFGVSDPTFRKRLKAQAPEIFHELYHPELARPKSRV